MFWCNVMKRVQIACDKEDWDASVVTVLGRVKNGRRCCPLSIKASGLPEPWLEVWHGLVEALKGVAPGEWAATFISAMLTCGEDGAAAVRLVVHRRWDDGTTAEPVVLVLGDAAAVEFFNYITEYE